MQPTIRYLILWLTDDCNLQCRYCYRPGVAVPQQMTVEVVARALQLASASGQPFHVQLSGGEPTLAPDLLAAVVDQMRPFQGQATLGVQTNATCLTPGLVRLFKEAQVQVGVSLDGPPAVHDALRGEFARTYAGLQLLEDQGVPFRVTTVVSADNVASLDLLALLLANFRQVRGLGLDLLTVKGAAVSSQVWPAAPADLRQGIRQLLQALTLVNAQRQPPLLLREAETLWRAWRQGPPSVFCHAGRGESLAVAPDGTVYPCGQTCGEDLLAAGTVWEPEISRLHLLGSHRRPRQAACHTCPLSAFCPGDCPSRLLFNHPQEAKLVCDLYQTIWGYWQEQGQTDQRSFSRKQGDGCAAL